MSVTIREAISSELEPFLAGYEWLFEPPGGVPPDWDPDAAGERLLAAIESAQSAVFGAFAEDGSLAGFCTAFLDLHSVRYGLRCWVEDLAIHPGQRSRRIGEQLLVRTRSWACARGATHLELDTGIARTDAQRFYERLDPDARTLAYGWRL